MLKKGLDADLYIVYDKITKKQAKSLSSKLVEKNYKCVAWNEKTFVDEENEATNTNKFLFFSPSLIDENISIKMAKTRTLSKGVSLVSIGNMHGVIVDPSAATDKSKWLPSFLVKNSIKKAKIKLYDTAVKFLTKDDIIKLIIPD